MNERVSASEIFSHDGIRDSLTHLAAPPYFYENLRREIASSQRSGLPLSLIRFVLESNGSSYEESVLNFADLLEKNFRTEDLLARIGKYEFALLIRGNQSVAEQLCQRFLSTWTLEGVKNTTPSYSTVTLSKKESALELLNRLDGSEMKSPTF